MFLLLFYGVLQCWFDYLTLTFTFSLSTVLRLVFLGLGLKLEFDALITTGDDCVFVHSSPLPSHR